MQGKKLSYIELGLESLKSRRWFRNLCCFYKIGLYKIGLPSYLSNLISSGVHSHNTWYSKDVVTYPCRTDTFKYPFFPQTGLDKSNSHLCSSRICDLHYVCLHTSILKYLYVLSKKISYLHSTWTHTILAVKSIESLYYWHDCKPFHLRKTEDPRGIFRTQLNI